MKERHNAAGCTCVHLPGLLPLHASRVMFLVQVFKQLLLVCGSYGSIVGGCWAALTQAS